MKIRTDFVTNSSSANFTVELQLKNDRDDRVTFSAGTTRDSSWDGQDEYYDGSSLYKELFEEGWHIKELGLRDPYEGSDGTIHLHGRSLSETRSIKEVIEGMIGLIRVTPYDYGILSGEKIFIVGEPVHYPSREALEEAIVELGGEVTGLSEAERVIYCGKERFCKRWPPGFSSQDLEGAEEDEYWEMSEAVDNEFREAALETWDWAKEPDGLFPFTIFTGDAMAGAESYAPDSHDWWGVCSYDNPNWDESVIPVISEREFAFFDPDGPAGDGTLSVMPGAVEVLARKCAEHGITRDNLRIIGGKIRVTPFGDSIWEYDDYADQWCINVKKGELRSTGRRVTRQAGSRENQGDIYDVDTSWRDTIWWPFRGKTYGTPYPWVTSGAVERDRVRYLDLSDFVDTRITNARRMFYGFENLQSLDLSCLDTSQVTNMSWMFADCRSLRELNLSRLDTAQVTDMRSMFNGCRDLLSLDLSCLDASHVTDMSSMFAHCSSLRCIDLTGLDTSQVTDMWQMFLYCKRLKEVDFSGLDTSHVTTMGYMFGNCESVEHIDLSGLDTSRVNDMRSMFHGCYKLRSLDLSGFDTSRVAVFFGMFNGCIGLRELDISGFDTSRATSMGVMFWNCNKLQSLDVSSFDTSRVTNMNSMFGRCSNLQSLDLSSFDTSRVTDMSEMFLGCTHLRYLDLSGFDASQLKSTMDMFKNCDSLERWSISETWPVTLRGAIPIPRQNGTWWSERDGRWMTVDEIRERGPMADAFTSKH